LVQVYTFSKNVEQPVACAWRGCKVPLVRVLIATLNNDPFFAWKNNEVRSFEENETNDKVLLKPIQ